MMNLADKRAWLDKHGYTVKYDFGGVTLTGIRWKTHGGLQFMSEGRTYEQIWDNLFDNVKENLFMWINDPK